MRNEARVAILVCAALGAFGVLGTRSGAQETTPRPMPAGGCPRPYVAAGVIQAAPPVTPSLAEQQGIQGVVQVVVSLNADSRVVGTRIMSSPSAVLNAAALMAARQSTFQTEIRDCHPIAADYIYSVDFGSKATFATTVSGERTVTVVGQGTVTRAPDVAYVMVNIVTQDDVPANALAKNDAAFSALTAKLRTLGIAEGKIRGSPAAQPFSLPTSVGGHVYRSSRQVIISVEALADAGHAAAASAAVPSVDMVAIGYALNERTSAYRDAIGVALKDAEQTAREAVAAEHQQLGVLKHVAVLPNESTRPPGLVVPFHLVPIVGGFTEPATPVPNVEVRAAATVTYAIKR